MLPAFATAAGQPKDAKLGREAARHVKPRDRLKLGRMASDLMAHVEAV
jgi:hypothetical protein